MIYTPVAINTDFGNGLHLYIYIWIAFFINMKQFFTSWDVLAIPSCSKIQSFKSIGIILFVLGTNCNIALSAVI